LDDPLGSLNAGELKLINRPTKTPAALEVAMRGTGDARAAAVPEGETFAKWKAQLVKSSAHPKAAYPIAAAFVRGLPAFAALAGTDDVKSAIATPLISSAVKTALGEFDRVREIFGQSYSDGAVWFYVVPEKQVKKTRAAGSMPLFWKMSIGGKRSTTRAGSSRPFKRRNSSRRHDKTLQRTRK